MSEHEDIMVHRKEDVMKRNDHRPGFDHYKAELEATPPGRILQLNTIGALTIVTAYRGLGDFETVLWDSRLPKYRDVGVLVSYWETLEVSEAFHHAYTKRIYASVFGAEVRERAKWLGKAAKECVSEITLDSDLHLFADED